MRYITAQILVFGLLFYAGPLLAQEWGDVSEDILGMSGIPEDSEADAVILFDKGTIAITLRFKLVIQRHTRIKILTERGLKYGDVSIYLGSDDKIDELRAQTILPNGKKITLSKKDIFTKKRRNGSEKVFAIPGLEVGSVIEYAYEITTERLTFLAPWQFQHREFTKLTELTLIIPEGFDYRAFASNAYVPDPQRESFQIADPQMGTSFVGRFVWRVENLPALKREPYITTLKDYWATLFFQIVSYRNPKDTMADPVIFIKTWDDLAETLQKSYNPLLRKTRTLEKRVLTLASEIQDDRTRAEAIYSFVRDSIETSASSGSRKRPNDVLKRKKGSSFEKNMLLIAMLKAAGFEASPLRISTRTNGRLQENWPQLQQLNYTIAHLSIDGDVYFLDTNDSQCPFVLLPPRFLSGKGFLVGEEEGKIVEIPMPKDASTSRANTQAKLTENGDLICQTTLQLEGYRGISERKELAEEKPEKYVKDILENRFGDVTIDTFQVIQDKDVDMPLEVKIDYRVQNYAQVVGDMVYCPSSLLHRRQSNPFKSEKRLFPVEINYGFASEESVDMALSEGFEIVEIPEVQKVTSLGVRFQSGCQADSNRVRLQRTFSVNRVYYTPAQYSRLRNAYTKIVSADQGQIVLRRKQTDE
ncbi:MAG: DUF3857 domain-containing protein [Candidatus Latescibacteria bacterium]|nr:DUF3857 domain-containing protein [Candidatus Latescibacterota bacterium]